VRNVAKTGIRKFIIKAVAGRTIGGEKFET